MAHTLVLNADYRPHALVTWQEALTYLIQGKARVLEEYEDWNVSSPSITFKVPSILVLVKYVVFRQQVKFTRANIYARDHYSCQYCGKKAGKGHPLSLKNLTFDHVLPRAQGGKTSWENITTACQSCNSRKANRTPDQAKMPLLQKPFKPTRINELEFSLSRKSVPDAWRDYLYWTQEIDSD